MTVLGWLSIAVLGAMPLLIVCCALIAASARIFKARRDAESRWRLVRQTTAPHPGRHPIRRRR